jgi:hypothetical protein
VLPDTQVLADWDVSHVIADYPMVNDRLELKDQVGATFIYANLDYAPSDASGWPRSWPDLPDEATVQRLNQITQATLWFSAACFGLALVYLLWRRSR